MLENIILDIKGNGPREMVEDEIQEIIYRLKSGDEEGKLVRKDKDK